MGNTKLQSNKVLYLSYDGLTDPLGQSQILPYLIGLAGKGYYITLISFEKSERFETGKAAIENLCKQNSIDWIPLHYHKTPPIVSTLYDVYMLWQTSRNRHRIENFAIVHCRSYITALVGLRLKRLFGIKFIFDMRGFWADERVEGGLWNVKNPVYRLVYNFFKRKEKLFLEESDHVISLTHNAKIEIKSWEINTPITVIPTCVDLELFDPAKIIEAEKQNLKTELGIGNDDFVLLYLGSWGTWYLTEQMLDCFVEVKGQKPQSKFLIISPDSINVADRPFADDVIIRSVTRAEVPKYVSIASAAVFFIKPTFSKKASSATKMGEIMAMNVPLITNTGWGDIDIITFEDVIVLKDFESESIKQAVKKILQMKTLRGSGKSLVDQSSSLSLTSGIIHYDSVYHELLSFSE